MAVAKPISFGAPFGENFIGHQDVVLFVQRPQTFVEHPVGISAESEAIVRVVVLALVKGMDVRCFDESVTFRGV